MNTWPTHVRKIVRRIVDGCSSDDRVRSLILVGSLARKEHVADEWSDVDLVLAVECEGFILESEEWVSRFGNPILTFVEDTASGQRKERRVMYEGGAEVDFVPVSTAALATLLKSDDAKDIINRGFQVLLDKDDWTAQIPVDGPETLSPFLPDEFEMRHLLNDFLYHAVWSAKKLKRGELWVAKACTDIYMKRCLLHLIEWNTRALHGTQVNTWFKGRFLEEWADDWIVSDLGRTFAHYDHSDVARALVATIDLFRRLFEETADCLNLSHHDALQDNIRNVVSELLDTA